MFLQVRSGRLLLKVKDTSLRYVLAAKQELAGHVLRDESTCVGEHVYSCVCVRVCVCV